MMVNEGHAMSRCIAILCEFLCRSSDSIACLQKLDIMENKSEKLKQEVDEILSFIKVNIYALKMAGMF